MAKESLLWSDQKRAAFERIKTLLALGSISAHLSCELAPTDAFPIALHDGRVDCSIKIVGKIVRITISKFDFVEPNNPLPGGGHVCAQVERLELDVYGSGRCYEIFERYGKFSIPDDVTRNRYEITVEYIATRFARKVSRTSLIRAFASENSMRLQAHEGFVSESLRITSPEKPDGEAPYGCNPLPFVSAIGLRITHANLSDQLMSTDGSCGSMFAMGDDRLADIWNYEFATPLHVFALSISGPPNRILY